MWSITKTIIPPADHLQVDGSSSPFNLPATKAKVEKAEFILYPWDNTQGESVKGELPSSSVCSFAQLDTKATKAYWVVQVRLKNYLQICPQKE